MSLAVNSVDGLAVDVETCAERGLALEDGGVEFVREGDRHGYRMDDGGCR